MSANASGGLRCTSFGVDLRLFLTWAKGFYVRETAVRVFRYGVSGIRG